MRRGGTAYSGEYTEPSLGRCHRTPFAKFKAANELWLKFRDGEHFPLRPETEAHAYFLAALTVLTTPHEMPSADRVSVPANSLVGGEPAGRSLNHRLETREDGLFFPFSPRRAELAERRNKRRRDIWASAGTSGPVHWA
jgi:hypothetical protein